MENKKIELNQLSAQRLKLLLKEKNMKQKELAPLIYVTEQTVSNWIKGHKGISEDNAQRIVKVLMNNPDRFSVDWLLGKSDYKTEREYLIHAEESTYLKKHLAASKLGILASLISVIFELDGVHYDIVPIDEDGKPLASIVDLNDKTFKRYALVTVDTEENITGYPIIFSRNELIVFLAEMREMIVNKIDFEIRFHTRRKENDYAEKE